MSANIIKYGNAVVKVCYRFGKNINITFPKVKVVGSQSSGKSTVIKRIIEYDILPMGDNMVTRTPIYVRLRTAPEHNTEVVLKLSYLNGTNIVEELAVTFQEGSIDAHTKQSEFKQAIIRLTDTITGGKYNISKTPIFVDVLSARVINFSFVDLPGLIVTASPDKGQPKDLKVQIDNLVREELLEPGTIAMVVVKSGIDLVTDLGIGLINEVRASLPLGTEFHTIGVLTKIDLLDAKMRNDLNFIISGRVTNSDELISQVETMSEGYFVVNNNTESLVAEKQYFMNNFDQNCEILAKQKYCVGYLKLHLQSHLANSITKLLPTIKNNLSDILFAQKQKTLQLGSEMETEQDKKKYVGAMISELSRIVRDILKDDNSGLLNIGPKIREAQNKFLTEVTALNPFSFENTSDTELKAIIDGFNGFHLTSNVSIAQLVDKCIKDQQKRPVMLIKPISDEFIRNVSSIIIDAIGNILKSNATNIVNLENPISSINSYPKFRALLQSKITTNVRECEINANSLINLLLVTKESYVWSTDPEFTEALGTHYLPKSNKELSKLEKDTFMTYSVVKSSAQYKAVVHKTPLFQYSYEPSQVRELASKYYGTIIKTMRDLIITIAFTHVINKLSSSINNQLNCLINPEEGEKSVTSLIVENSVTTRERQMLRENIALLEETIEAGIIYEA